MQIRQLSMKELYEAYELVRCIRDISYETFEDLVYEMKEHYTMIGVFQKERLLALAGLDIVTTLQEGRHIRVYEFVAVDRKSEWELKKYLEDYAKISAAKKVVYES